MVNGILDGLRWLGLHWDEGPAVGGPFAPYFNPSGTMVHRVHRAAHRGQTRLLLLLHTGRAEREARSRRAIRRWIEVRPHMLCIASGRHRTGVKRHGCHARCGSGCQTARCASTTSCTVQSSSTAPTSRTSSSCVRMATPPISSQLSSDDIDMAITHVVRGDDHISNTPKQILLYQAMDAELPRSPMCLSSSVTTRSG